MSKQRSFTEGQIQALENVLAEVFRERERQHAKWGFQNHPNGTTREWAREADAARERCERAFARGEGTYRHILAEEVTEAFAESDPAKLRAELVQVAAVAVQWIEAIDVREHLHGLLLSGSEVSETRGDT